MIKEKPTVGILNIAGGNIKSIYSAIDKSEYQVEEILALNSHKEFDVIILPGVGNVSKLSSLIWGSKFSLLDQHIKKKRKIIGICMGMQILSKYTTESNPISVGLSLIDGYIKKLETLNFQVGWNSVSFTKNSRFHEFNECDLYFNHGYFLSNTDDIYISGYTQINDRETIPSVIEKDNIIGFQFHPEKSQIVGRKILNLALKV